MSNDLKHSRWKYVGRSTFRRGLFQWKFKYDTSIIRQLIFHLLPILSTTAIIYVNSHRVYIGVDFPGLPNTDTTVLAVLQVVAKVHEIFISISLGQIVWHAVRYSLFSEIGLPLSWIGAGFEFNSPDFYITKEFWSGLQALISARKRIWFLGLLPLCGITAIFAGPSSAVLLVPHSQIYSVGHTDVYINGSFDQTWPIDLSDDSSQVHDLEALCADDDSVLYDICPAGGFTSLWQRWSTTDYRNLVGNSVQPWASGLSGSYFYWPVQSAAARMPSLYTIGDPNQKNWGENYTWTISAHAGAAIMLDRVTRDWWSALLSVWKLKGTRYGDRAIEAPTYNAYTAVRCTEAQNVSLDQVEVSFPSISGRWDWARSLGHNALLPNVTSSDQVRFRWVQLPDEFGAVSVGAVIELPWGTKDTSRAIIGCSTQAGYVPSSLRNDAYVFWSGWYPYGVDWGGRVPAYVQPVNGQSLSATNGRVALGSRWLDLLTPPSPIVTGRENHTSISTVESLLEAADVWSDKLKRPGTTVLETWVDGDNATSRGRATLLESIIASLISDGLSRTSAHQVFNNPRNASDSSVALYQRLSDFDQRVVNKKNGLVEPQQNSASYGTLAASFSVSGFSYQADLASVLAVVVLAVHALLAISHIMWLLYRPKPYECWESLPELVILAQGKSDKQQLMLAPDRRTPSSSSLSEYRAMAKIVPVSHAAALDPTITVGQGQQSPPAQNRTHTSSDEPEQHALSSLSSDTSRINGDGSDTSAGSGQARPADSGLLRPSGRVSVAHSTQQHSRGSSTERLLPS